MTELQINIDDLLKDSSTTAETIHDAIVNKTVSALPTPAFWFGNVVAVNLRGELKICVVAGVEYDDACTCGHQGWHYTVREHLDDKLGQHWRLAEPALTLAPFKARTH